MSLYYTGLDKKYSTENYTTTDAWTQARGLNTDDLKTKTIIIINTDPANDIMIKVNGSVDDGANYDVPLQTETTLNPGQIIELNIYDAYTDIEVKTKASVAGSQGICTTRGYAIGV